MKSLSNKHTMTTVSSNSMTEGMRDCGAHLRCDRAESKEESDEQKVVCDETRGGIGIGKPINGHGPIIDSDQTV